MFLDSFINLISKTAKGKAAGPRGDITDVLKTYGYLQRKENEHTYIRPNNIQSV